MEKAGAQKKAIAEKDAAALVALTALNLTPGAACDPNTTGAAIILNASISISTVGIN